MYYITHILEQKINNMEQDTTYQIKIIAENAAGRSEESDWLTVTTKKAGKYIVLRKYGGFLIDREFWWGIYKKALI